MEYGPYIDEVGTSDLKASHDPDQLYLSLNGVIVSLDYLGATLDPGIERH